MWKHIFKSSNVLERRKKEFWKAKFKERWNLKIRAQKIFVKPSEYRLFFSLPQEIHGRGEKVGFAQEGEAKRPLHTELRPQRANSQRVGSIERNLLSIRWVQREFPVVNLAAEWKGKNLPWGFITITGLSYLCEAQIHAIWMIWRKESG